MFCKRKKKLNTGYPSIDKTHLQGLSRQALNPFIPSVSISTAIDLISFGHMHTPVIEQRDLKVTRGEYIKDAKMVAKALLQLGIREGDIIVVSTPNLYQSLVIFKAANRIGAIITFINNEAEDAELIKRLKIYNSPILVTYNQDEQYAEHIINNSAVRFVINIDAKKVDSRKQIGIPEINSNFIHYHQLESIASHWNYPYKKSFSGQQDALILYTSGSTGEPKSMLFTNENVIAALMYLKYSTHAKPYKQESFWWLGVVPFMYPYGFICSVMVPLLGGFGARLAPDMNNETLNDYLAKDSQVICGSPALLDVIFKNLKKDVKMPSLNTFLSGGDFLSAQKSQAAMIFFRKHGATHATICNGSGNGEALGCVTNAMGYQYRPETVGKLVLGPDYVIMKDPKTGQEAKYNEPGELWISGKHIFKQYYKNLEQTGQVIQCINGKRYYCTGNYGSLDTDRYFTLIGRASRFYINSAFKKVYCEKVQRAVAMSDLVKDCAVVPMPDDQLRFVSKAYVVLKKGIAKTTTTKKQITNYLQNTLDRGEVALRDYEIPRAITFIDKLPRTTADKIDYEKLRKRAEGNQ